GFSHSNAAVRSGIADRVLIVRSMNVIVGLLKEDFHGAHRILRVAGRCRLFPLRPAGVGGNPGRIPDEMTNDETAHRRRVSLRADGDVVMANVDRSDANDENLLL